MTVRKNWRNSRKARRTVKRLWVHGLIKKVSGTRKYYLTKLGKAVITLGLKTEELFIVPQLAPVEAATS
ncbi:MAG TPA: hypothetical protein VLH40_07815 [Atribacteraceae bacterium]|nr:hypothetical protein [Atribacteraceae bacterium]